MAKTPEMVDMARTPDDMARAMAPSMGPMGQSQYPYGLSISLTHEELDKLGLDADCEVGDMVHLFAMAKVTAVSSNASESTDTCRIELQIMQLAVEDEDDENAEMMGSSQGRANKRYGKNDPEDAADGADDEAAEGEA